MERRTRWRPSNFTAPVTPLRVANAIGTDGGAAAIYLYDAIDEWGGEWGVSASELVSALNGVQASRLDLHLNSPGGSYYEAVAMRAALLSHPAEVHVYVDGLAASAASVLATVGARVVMAQGSQQMIHKASSISFGNADQMREDADQLDTVDRMIAGFYAARAGRGSVDDWLVAMAAETWYTPEEAIAAGLADEVAASPVRDTEPVAAVADRWILASWKYAGRDAAPDPAPPEPAAPDPAAVPAATPSSVEQPHDQQQAVPCSCTPTTPVPEAAPEPTAAELPTAAAPAPPAPELPPAADSLSELLCSAFRKEPVA